MNFTSESQIALAEDIVCRVNQDGTVIVMKMNEDEFFYKINGVAAEMWQKFSTEQTCLGHVIEGIAKNYSMATEQILKDSQEFLSKVHQLKFIHLK